MRKKFIVVTTIPASLRFFEGQLGFLNQTFEVIAVSSDKKVLEEVGRREGISVHCIPMERPISLCKLNLTLCMGILQKAVSYQCFQQK